MPNKKLIFEELRKLAMLTNIEASPERLQLYTEILADRIGDDAIKAISNMHLKCKFFPSVAEILDNHYTGGDAESAAQRLADDIVAAIPLYGYTNETEARSWLGELAWEVVESMGGWAMVCKTDERDLGTLRAQMRNSSKARIKHQISENKSIEFARSELLDSPE